MKTSKLVLVGALVGAAIQSVYGQGAYGAAASKQAPTPVLNQWLREQSDAFKAWDIGGQFRLRYEWFEGGSPAFPNRDFQSTGVDNNNDFLLLREKFHIGYTPCKWLTIYGEMRDSSSSGDDAPSNPGADQFDLHQAYIKLGDQAQFPITAKVGRQEMIYGDERVIGAGDWTNVGRVFDAAKLRYDNGKQWVDIFSGRQVLVDNHNFNVVDDYDWFSGIYASCTEIIPIQATEVYVLSRNASAGTAAAGVRGTSPGSPQNSSAGSARDIYSMGTRFKSLPGKIGAWDYTLEAVYQLGSINQGGRRVDQEAFAGSVGGGYTWTKTTATPRLGVEYNYSSGDEDPTDGTNRTFDNLFPTNHKHYGYMDFVGWRNMHNPRVNLSLKPDKKLLLSLDFHGFWLVDDRDLFYPQQGGGRSANGYGANSGFDKFVGTELDLDGTYTVNNWLSFRGGYGHFFAGEYIKQSKAPVGGAADADWFYIQTSINF